jgi:hypothetical protein
MIAKCLKWITSIGSKTFAVSGEALYSESPIFALSKKEKSFFPLL